MPNIINLDKYTNRSNGEQCDHQKKDRQFRKLEWIILSSLQSNQPYSCRKLGMLFNSMGYTEEFYNIIQRVKVTEDGIYFVEEQ